MNQPIAARHPLRRTIGGGEECIYEHGFHRSFRAGGGALILGVRLALRAPGPSRARDARIPSTSRIRKAIEIGGDDYVKAATEGARQVLEVGVESNETAEKAVLRTQVTSVSAHYISDFVKKMAEADASPPLPIKLFSVGRVFRNEKHTLPRASGRFLHDRRHNNRQGAHTR